MKLLTGITVADIVALLPDKVSLHYVDYRDNLDEHQELIQEHIRCNPDNYPTPLEEAVDEWYQDDHYGFDEVYNDLCEEVADKYDLDPDDNEAYEEFDDQKDVADQLLQVCKDWIDDEIYERDDSDPMKDLIRNTSKQAFFYDLGVEIPSCQEGVSDVVNQIKDAIGIKRGDRRFNEKIREMVVNNYNGGSLYVYFYDSIDRWVDYNIKEKKWYIKFDAPVLACVDHWSGSGWHTDGGLAFLKSSKRSDRDYRKGFKGKVTRWVSHSIKLPFEPDKLFVEGEHIKYNYTYSVCGMNADWCRDTRVTLTPRRKEIESEGSALNDIQDVERRYKEAWSKGKCTFGDMNITRHKDTPYRNDFPCGCKCTECGTFWID